MQSKILRVCSSTSTDSTACGLCRTDMYFLDRNPRGLFKGQLYNHNTPSRDLWWRSVLTVFDGAAAGGLLKAEGQQTGLVTDS